MEDLSKFKAGEYSKEDVNGAWQRLRLQFSTLQSAHTDSVEFAAEKLMEMANLRKYNTALVDKIDGLQQEISKLKGSRTSMLLTIGGAVDGQPTAEHNFLQRLRELVRCERQLMALERSLEGESD